MNVATLVEQGARLYVERPAMALGIDVLHTWGGLRDRVAALNDKPLAKLDASPWDLHCLTVNQSSDTYN